MNSWMIGLVLAVGAGLWLLLATRRQAPAGDALRDKVNAQAYREQLAMLEQRREAQEITPAEFDTEKTALDRRLLDETTPATRWQHGPFGLATRLLIFAVPVVLGAGLFWISDGQQHAATASAENTTPSVEEMVSGLAQRLAENPDDLRGWAMLGRSYSVMGRHRDAAQAYQQANRLSENENAELLIAEAEALALHRQQDFEGRPQRLLDQALALEPDHVRGLWYSALAAGQRGDGAKQAQQLQRLARQPDLPPELQRILREDFGIALGAAAAPAGSVEVLVDASDAAQAAAPGAVLYVFARAQDGPPMPLAVHRQPAPSEWPLRVTLDDSMAMMPEHRLSSASAWTLTARLSRSGQAQASSGDWQGSTTADRESAQPVSIRIDAQAP